MARNNLIDTFNEEVLKPDPISVLEKNINSLIAANKLIINNKILLDIFDKSVKATIKCYKQGGRLYIAGNGGSAADAQHLAAEFVSKLARDRNPLPAEALTTDSSIITAIGNDYGFDFIFARQLQGKLQKNDMFLGITTSGNSINIIEALKVCNEKSIDSILFTGRDGGSAVKLAKFPMIVTGTETSTIQEQHILLAHSLCECVENELFKV
jgi:D-sedoheptulose 7-phosphate isomerase